MTRTGQMAAMRWEAAGRPRRGSAAARLLARVPARSEISLGDAIALTGRSRESVRRAINRLAAAGVLRETTGRERGRRWVCDIPLAQAAPPIERAPDVRRFAPRDGKPHVRLRSRVAA